MTKSQAQDKAVFTTPQPLARFMAQALSPQPNDIIYDPACGQCTMFIETYYCAKRPDQEVQPINVFVGFDVNQAILDRGIENMRECGLNTTCVQKGNPLQEATLLDDLQDNMIARILSSDGDSKGDIVILTHPPFGKYDQAAQDKKKKKTLYENLFLDHCMESLRVNTEDRCGIIVSQKFLISDNKDDERCRSRLVDQCNLLMVIDLPSTTFGKRYPTFLLLFNKSGRTQRILRCRIPELLHSETIKGEDFAKALDAWKHREQILSHNPSQLSPEQAGYIWTRDADELRYNGSGYCLVDPPPTIDKESAISLSELIDHLDQQSSGLHKLVEHLRALVMQGKDER